MSPEQRTQLEGMLDKHGRTVMPVLMFMGLDGTDEATEPNDGELVQAFDTHFTGDCYAENNIKGDHPDDDEPGKCMNFAKELRDGRACSEARQDIIRTTLELGFVELATLAAEMDRWICAHQRTEEET